MRTDATMTRSLLTLMCSALLLAGCANNKPVNNSVFDFGPASTTANTAPAPARTITTVVVAQVTGPATLDNERMFYRLNYADPLEARTYAHSRWSATPLELLTQRFKQRLSQAGYRVLATTDAADGLPTLRIEVDDFSHSFDSVSASHGELAVRVSLVQSHRLLDQRAFSRRSPAAASAAGGAAALAASTDAVADDIAAWLGAVPAPAASRP